VIDGPYFDKIDDPDSTFYIDFTDGLQLAFRPYPRPVPPPRLTYVQLRFGASGEELARFNVHGQEGGGKFTLIPLKSCYRRELGAHWKLAHDYLKPRPFDTPERLRAWSYLDGSLVYADALEKPAQAGLLGDDPEEGRSC
jgi:hypothetical protein